MTEAKTARCRFCAAKKPHRQLINLRTDELKRLQIQEKLTRLCIAVADLDSVDDILEKTICFSCNNSLSKAFHFVKNVETAQVILSSQQNLEREISLDKSSQSHVKPESEINDLLSDERDLEKDDDINLKREICEALNNNETLRQLLKSNSHKNGVVVDITELQNNNQRVKQLNSIQAGTFHEYKFEKETRVIPLKTNTNNDTLNNEGPQQSTWNEYSWMCAYCDTVFPHIDEMRKHSMQFHSCCNVYQCMDCKSKKFQLCRFIKHVTAAHRKHLRLQCYKCFMVFRTSKDLQYHKATHQISTHKCHGCNETFMNLTELKQHMETYKKEYKHPIPQDLQQLADNLTCILCDKTFNTKGTLKQHLLIHTERQRNYTCDKCGKSFVTKGEIAKHFKTHEAIKQYECAICSNTYRSARHLRNHISVHFGEKPFECNRCGRRFRLQSYLNSHARVHNDSRPWVCSVCEKAFRFKGNLIAHTRQHTGEKPYSCKFCTREFTNWSNYMKHMKNRHGQKKKKSNVRNVECIVVKTL